MSTESTAILNAAQAAKRYGLSESWLAKLRVFGGGPRYLKVGRRVLYEPEAFEEWLASHQRSSTSETTLQRGQDSSVKP